MAYRLEFKASARREVDALPRRDGHRVIEAISALASAPRPVGARKLKGAVDAYRIRVGDYRVVYQIFDQVLLVFIIRIAHRKEVYRGL